MPTIEPAPCMREEASYWRILRLVDMIKEARDRGKDIQTLMLLFRFRFAVALHRARYGQIVRHY